MTLWRVALASRKLWEDPTAVEKPMSLKNLLGLPMITGVEW